METTMFGMMVKFFFGVVGVVDGVSVDGAGRSMVRVDDRWFEAADCIGV